MCPCVNLLCGVCMFCTATKPHTKKHEARGAEFVMQDGKMVIDDGSSQQPEKPQQITADMPVAEDG